MKKKRKEKMPLVCEEKYSEDLCFECREGGLMRICDQPDCPKCYHPHCLKKEESFLDSEELWSCGWHFCLKCNRTASFHCYCCPQAVCLKCVSKAKFVVVRKNKGFCEWCLYYLSLYEENQTVDSYGDTVNFDDLTTYEGLLKDYYVDIKPKNGLTTADVISAKKRAEKGEFYEGEEDGSSSDIAAIGTKRRKSSKGQPPVLKKLKNAKSEKELQFSGWGSSRLIAFLEAIGEDTSKELSELQVENRIKAYAKEERLFDPKKKASKMILCDAKLQSLFQVKAINKHKIGRLIKPHFATFVPSEEEEGDGEDKDEQNDSMVSILPRRKRKEENDSPKAKAASHTQAIRSVSVVCDNVKALYLRKSLLLELSKYPETFQKKVEGSLIRTKTDPRDYTQKNSHELLQVTGVQKSNTTGEIILLVSTIRSEIHMNSVSDVDFQEAECAELRERVKAGRLRWPTYEEFEAKARMLHEDITKHWISRRLVSLKYLIERANEKGCRRELFELLDERKKLEKASEQEKLISKIPEIVVDTFAPQPELASIASDTEEKDTNYDWDWEACDNYYSDDAGSGDNKAPYPDTARNIADEIERSGIKNGVAGSGDIKVPSAATKSDLAVYEVEDSVASIEAANGSGAIKVPYSDTTSNLADEIERSGIKKGVASKEAVYNYYGSGDIKGSSAATKSDLAVYVVEDSGASIDAANGWKCKWR